MSARLLLIAGMSCLVACREGNVKRDGAEQRKIVAATIPVALPVLRGAILKSFTTSKADLPRPFSLMTVSEPESPDWLETMTDAGGFLVAYKSRPADFRKQDLVLREPPGDV